MNLYRAKAYAIFGLPNRPKVCVDILYGPWKDREPSAQNMAKLFKQIYPNLNQTIQVATRSS